MKKQNKKEMGFPLWLKLLFGGFFIFTFFYIFFVIVPDITNPKFTITEKVCEEKIIQVQTQCYFDNSSLFVEVMECQKNPEWILVNETICTDEPREEIEYMGRCAVPTITINPPEYLNLQCGSYDCLQSISLSNLSEEWLDENAEKVHLECSDKNNNKGIFNEEGKIESCNEFQKDYWKLNNYTITRR